MLIEKEWWILNNIDIAKIQIKFDKNETDVYDIIAEIES